MPKRTKKKPIPKPEVFPGILAEPENPELIVQTEPTYVEDIPMASMPVDDPDTVNSVNLMHQQLMKETLLNIIEDMPVLPPLNEGDPIREISKDYVPAMLAWKQRLTEFAKECLP